MSAHRFVRVYGTGVLLLAILGLIATAGRADEESLKRRKTLREELAQMRDAQLEERLLNPVPQPAVSPREETGDDFVLSEVLKRDKKWAIPLLQKVLAKPVTRGLRPAKPESDLSRNISVLTALRRAEGSPDPIEVILDVNKPTITTSTDQLPTFKAFVKNVDAKKESVFLIQGGDYRSGRPERWRVVMKDEQGRSVKPIVHFGFVGGGMASEGSFEPGETWGTEIVVRNFVEPPQPGKYTLQVLFHNDIEIARLEDIEGLIVCHSKSIELIIEKFKISVSAADAAVVRSLLTDLDGKEPLKIAAGTYGRWAHDAISPNSPPGKLLAFGKPAVPLLIEAVQSKDLTPEKRAWLLSILFSLTAENDPRKERGVLGAYSYSEGPWAMAVERNGEKHGFSFRTSSTGAANGGKIEPERQLELAVKWQDWLKTYCEVSVEKE